MTMLGILCGLESEAAIARRIKDARVAISAARPDQAKEAAFKLVQLGATRLLSFGLAGGLKPGLPAGTLIIASTICAVGETKHCDDYWNAKLRRKLPKAIVGPVWASGTIVKRSQDKKTLFEQSGCLAADMESCAVSKAALEARIPFVVVRAIADTAEMDLPPAALVPLRGDGRVEVGKVFKSILKSPAQSPSLIHLGRNTCKAMLSLKKAALYLQ